MPLPPDVDPRQPVIVGVGQHLDREGARDPVDLMVEAVEQAARDAGSPGLAAAAQVIGVVPSVSWRYFAPARRVAVSSPAFGAHRVAACWSSVCAASRVVWARPP